MTRVGRAGPRPDRYDPCDRLGPSPAPAPWPARTPRPCTPPAWAAPSSGRRGSRGPRRQGRAPGSTRRGSLPKRPEHPSPCWSLNPSQRWGVTPPRQGLFWATDRDSSHTGGVGVSSSRRAGAMLPISPRPGPQDPSPLPLAPGPRRAPLRAEARRGVSPTSGGRTPVRARRCPTSPGRPGPERGPPALPPLAPRIGDRGRSCRSRRMCRVLRPVSGAVNK